MDLGGVQVHINGLPTTVLFDNEYQRADQFGRITIQTSAPMATLPTHVAESLGVEQNSQVITPDDKCYLVKEVKADGLGMTEIRLVLQS